MESKDGRTVWRKRIQIRKSLKEVNMKKIYLIGYFEDCKYPGEVLNELELIPESKLVETVKTMIDEERICPDLFDEDEDGEKEYYYG